MAYTRVQSLFVLTLLQLCRAEISDKLPEWYSANVINDGYQPKSISEIFSTDSPFSSTNPIVVLPKLTTTDKLISSSILPSSLTDDDIKKTSIIPLPPSTPVPPTLSTIPPQISADFTSRFPSQPPQVEITQYTEQTNPPSSSFFETQPELRQTTFSTAAPPSNLGQQTTLLQDPSSAAIGRFLVPGQNDPELLSTQQSTTPRPLPYFVIYQQNPQNLENLSGQGGLFGTALAQQSSTTSLPSSTVVIQPTTTVSPLTSKVTSSSSLPVTLTSTSQGSTSRRPTRVPTSVGLTTRPPTTQSIQPSRICVNGTPSIGSLPIKIRVVAPRGSITHVNINPPAPTTTTKRPTTTRTRKTPKPKKNTYDACLNGCKVRREPICAIPLSATWIDPEQLKGFPSVCHMACFNSYKKEPYEKLLDGRCGRLRTRIQTFDSKTKLKREELNKAQYFVDGGDQTIVEVSPLRRNN